MGRIWNHEESGSFYHGNLGCSDLGWGRCGDVVRNFLFETHFSTSLLSFTCSPGSITTLWWRPTLNTYLTCHSAMYIPTFYSRPQLLLRDLWQAQLHLWKVGPNYFFLQSQKTQTFLSTIVPLPLNLFNLSETSASFQCLDFPRPHLRSFQDKITINYQDNKCSLPVLSFSYWTPSSKTHDGWIHSSSSWLLLDWENCMTITTVPLQKGSHSWPTQFFLRPNMDPQPCLSIFWKIITNLHYPPGAIYLTKECLKENER